LPTMCSSPIATKTRPGCALNYSATESGGAVHNFEDPALKIQDIRNVATYQMSARIYAIC
jgi:hypothetical protein